MGEYAEDMLRHHMTHMWVPRSNECRCLKCKRRIKSAEDICGEGGCPIKTTKAGTA